MNTAKAKFIRSLHQKKYRKESGLFIIEGEKSILELLDSQFVVTELYITHEFFKKYQDRFASHRDRIELVAEGELAKISTLEFNDTGVAVAKHQENTLPRITDTDIVLALDDIRDPGNLGTIIRTADWYGITKVVCSTTTAELYNPKVIAASMGSFTRVSLYYTDLETFLSGTSLSILGAMLNGENIHNYSFPKSGILLMGSEANGISDKLLPLLTHKLTIPRYGNTESLNVGIATGILLDNWKRNLGA